MPKKEMTIEEFQRDIASRKCCYAISQRSPTSPVMAIMHISDVVVVPTYPEVVMLSDGINCIRISQVQSITLDDDRYTIVCGVMDDLRESITIKIERMAP